MWIIACPAYRRHSISSRIHGLTIQTTCRYSSVAVRTTVRRKEVNQFLIRRNSAAGSPETAKDATQCRSEAARLQTQLDPSREGASFTGMASCGVWGFCGSSAPVRNDGRISGVLRGLVGVLFRGVGRRDRFAGRGTDVGKLRLDSVIKKFRITAAQTGKSCLSFRSRATP